MLRVSRGRNYQVLRVLHVLSSQDRWTDESLAQMPKKDRAVVGIWDPCQTIVGFLSVVLAAEIGSSTKLIDSSLLIYFSGSLPSTPIHGALVLA